MQTFGSFFSSVKASWAPFCAFLASKSGKKGSSRFALYQCDFSGCWTPFWGSCSPNLAKRGPAACSFGVPWFSFSFSSRWSSFWGSCSPNLAKRGPAACSFGVPWSCLSFSSCWAPFCAAGVLDPPKRGPAASDFRFLPFSLCWTPFPAVSGRDPPKRGAATWHLCSSHFGFNLLFLWRRESALLLCKRIPLRHYNARAWTWPPLLWRETGLLLLLIGFSLSTAGPLFQPWAAEILQKGAPQLDLNVASISASTCFFFGAGKVHCFFARGSRCATTMQGLELDLRFCEGKLDCFFCWSASPYLPLDPFSSRERPRSSKKGRRNLTSNVLPFGSSQCLCHTQRLYHRQLSWFLPSVLVGLSGLLSFGRSLSRNTVRNDVCRAHLSLQAGLAQLVE